MLAARFLSRNGGRKLFEQDAGRASSETEIDLNEDKDDTDKLINGI
jgi:hypothetical protein